MSLAGLTRFLLSVIRRRSFQRLGWLPGRARIYKKTS